MIVIVADATGEVLDYLAAKADKWTAAGLREIASGDAFPPQYHYSRDWETGGFIVDEHIPTLIKRDGVWSAECYDMTGFCLCYKGPTALIAATRAFVASRLGWKVENVPESLLKAT